jgi:hypothetical protein
LPSLFRQIESDEPDTILPSSDEGDQQMGRTNALRALHNLCVFIGAIVLFSYFYNWAVDLRHWYVTLASAIACVILWLGFYVIEVRGGITHVFSQFASGLSRLRTKSEIPSATTKIPAELPVPVDPPAASHAEPKMTAPNPLPWLNPRRVK